MQHHPHHSQGPAAPQHLQHPRPSSIVHQQHHQAPPPQSQHPSAYSSYQPAGQAQSAHSAQDGLPYYAHPSPYSTPGTTSGYPAADTSDMMAAAPMPRPYPPMSYHTPQSNSPASVASPSAHDQHRSIYGQPAPSQLQQQSMYYSAQQPQYSSMPAQTAPSPYQQHAQQPHQPMGSQPNMMMSHAGPQHQMTQHASQHAQQGMTGSPRHAKMEPQVPPQLQRPASGPMGTPQQQHAQNGAGPLSTPGGSSPGVNSNAAPGPIPATTPLVVRQDNNGVQWIAFEYSRDRVKMEYTIRCDVESVNTDELPSDFKTENCVYPRACCPKDQYRGNRLQYETECNTVGWALAQLNPSLRGKRGLIQRAVDSWRNSNQDPRLRSRRVRRMAKMNNRKAVQTPHPAHMSGPSGPAGMPTPGAMGPGGGTAMGKPGMSNMGPQMHHHHAHSDGNSQGGDEVGDGEYMDEGHHHHHQAPSGPGSGHGDDVRQAQVFAGYPQPYPSNAGSASGIPPPSHHNAIAARHQAKDEDDDDKPEGLFPDIPDAKKRKFILVDDNKRGCRLRVRVALDLVDTKEIPDSFRKSSSVYPRSHFPREMQSPPPSATGSRFFQDDLSDDDVEVDGGRTGRSRGHAGRDRVMVKVPMSDGSEGEVAIPRTRRHTRGKEVRLNDLGYRMAWLQSRVFSGRTIFLQRALDCYRNKTRNAIESIMQDVKTAAPHYETRVGKRRWSERMRQGADKRDDE
ncbi:hypothetical protein JX266_010106 [Neoarthrinium moseri]|uniref:uncharacterized protein n=1 Tax=Neoarthrinium moseri TaxID=1658444 RepID=UPI001FDB0936|nr:uncharacterized protein JN550_001515 [Neoarthrinium moseri]KAI1843660.1 hypothetical protein JX266_010106 [Neoarthrinium moseri]KAI1876019.1 hypothetical protein JN550_001515 [Neoarthrinium moseri]